MNSISEPKVAAESFVASQLLQYLDDSSFLPRSWGTQTELTPLLNYSHRKLSMFIDFLGLHDLSKELPQVLDKERLKNIYSFLTKAKRNYLKLCLKTKDKAPFPKIQLNRWDGDIEKLRKVLHIRGIMRLGLAISEEPQHFRWHLYHILDTGRAKVLQKSIPPKKVPNLLSMMHSQVIALMKLFQEEGHGKTR